MTSKTLPEKCPFCGQTLLNKTAAERLVRKQGEFEREVRRVVRTEAEVKAREKVRAVQKEEREAARLQMDEMKKQLELKQREVGRLKERQAAERTRMEKSIRTQVGRDFAKRSRALEQSVDALQRQKEELERRVERLTAQERGEFHEVDIFERLVQGFPGDKIEKRGRGGDILHTVRHQSGGRQREAGLILYECKDTLRWSNDFITQIRKAGRSRKTPYLVLVTKAFPRGQKWVLVRNDVVIAHPAYAVYLAEVVRRMVIETDRAGLAASGHDEKTALLYEYLASDRFRQSFQAVVEAADQLSELLGSEKQAHERTWTRREHAYSDLGRQTSA
ncbi:MAG: DUF2130 domain-containing protein [Actinomycetota bacterium]